MTRISDDRKRMLVKISTLYYLEGLTQNEITKTLGISRPQISRMLAEARELGLVNITVYDPFSNENKCEKILTKCFGLKEVIVVNSAQSVSVNTSLGSASAALLERLIRNDDIIGVNAGNSLSYIGVSINRTNKKNISVVPLVGGWGPSGAKWQANLSVKALAEKLDCNYWQLNAPAFVSSKQTRDALLAENEISYVLEMARKASIALVGIGQMSPHSTLIKTGFLAQEHIDELKAKGAVANICNSFIDGNSKQISFSAYENMIGLTIEDLHDTEKIIGVAAGKDKVDAIYAALNGGWLNYFVTDLETAQIIVAKYLAAAN